MRNLFLEGDTRCSVARNIALLPLTRLAHAAIAPNRMHRGLPKNAKSSQIKSHPRIVNPRAAALENAITSLLQQQRQAAEAEAAQMKLSTRTAGPPAGQSQPQAQNTATGAKSPGRFGAVNPGPIQNNQKMGKIGPGKTMDESGNTAGSRISSLAGSAGFEPTLIECAKDPAMRIMKVSGKAAPATFTTDQRFNFYTVMGCSFGDPGPNAKAYIYNTSVFHQEFQIEEWHDNWIKLHMNPALTGVLDQDNLTLVVQRADGKQASKRGYKFSAARETTHLYGIPQRFFSLDKFTMNDVSHLSPIYNSPSNSKPISSWNQTPGIPGHTAEVIWYCTNCMAYENDPGNIYMTANRDYYKLDSLQPGFVGDSASLGEIDMQAVPPNSVHTEGTFDLRWIGDNQIAVSWQGQTGVSSGCGGFAQDDCFSTGFSHYLLDVWVKGPRGVNPWTGKPTAP